MKHLVPWAIGLTSGILVAMPAVADVTYQIEVSNAISEEQPTCMVDVYAVFEPGLYALAGVEFDMLAGTDPGDFYGSIIFLKGPGTRTGNIPPHGDKVANVLSGQIKQLPLEPHLKFENPVRVWRGKWTTTDFTPRTIELRTATHHFEVYEDDRFKALNRMGFLSEASAVIRVGCYADCDQSDALDLFDLFCFVNDFNNGDGSADCDGNGEQDLFDFLCFVNAFSAGC